MNYLICSTMVLHMKSITLSPLTMIDDSTSMGCNMFRLVAKTIRAKLSDTQPLKEITCRRVVEEGMSVSI